MNIKKLLSLGLVLSFVAAGAVVADGRPEKVDICHYDEQGDISAIKVWPKEFNGYGPTDHKNHGDFLYEGSKELTKDDAKVNWCEDNQPGDVCPNIDGKQEEAPEGYEISDQDETFGQCVEIEEEPEEEPEEPVVEEKPEVKEVTTTVVTPATSLK